MEALKSWIWGAVKFVLLVTFCGIMAVLSVAGLQFTKPKPTAEAKTRLISINNVKVDNMGKVKDVYGKIDPAGPIRPYDIYCASKLMMNGPGDSSYPYAYSLIIYPMWFYPSVLVSPETVCTRNTSKLRSDYVLNPARYYREIASGSAEFRDLMIAEQYKGFNKTNPKLYCKAEVIGVFGPNYEERTYVNAIIKPYGVYMVYSSRDIQCTSSQSVVKIWKSQWFTEIPTPQNP